MGQILRASDPTRCMAKMPHAATGLFWPAFTLCIAPFLPQEQSQHDSSPPTRFVRVTAACTLGVVPEGHPSTRPRDRHRELPRLAVLGNGPCASRLPGHMSMHYQTIVTALRSLIRFLLGLMHLDTSAVMLLSRALTTVHGPLHVSRYLDKPFYI